MDEEYFRAPEGPAETPDHDGDDRELLLLDRDYESLASAVAVALAVGSLSDAARAAERAGLDAVIEAMRRACGETDDGRRLMVLQWQADVLADNALAARVFTMLPPGYQEQVEHELRVARRPLVLLVCRPIDYWCPTCGAFRSGGSAVQVAYRSDPDEVLVGPICAECITASVADLANQETVR